MCEPDAEPAPANVWFLRGWFPYGPEDPEHRSAGHHVAADVDPDGQLPAGWGSDGGGHHHVNRVLAHWQASGEDQPAPNVSHVCADGADWELLRHAGLWQAGVLPALPGHSHDH
ncbi:hypothetical protein [Nocardiopsis halotolerans]|uniref:hypothetical protein n=1 Tax=Nocardiopsis halotolerans TaxID=124252 RepID=UPI00034D6627|nr:hypothetical protein [Nocardiopsis halotolerans]